MTAVEGPAQETALVGFFTAVFPYLPGEQFIEPEIIHWSGLSWGKVILCPYNANGSERPVPDDITVIKSQSPQVMQMFWCAVKAAFSPLLWRELKYLYEAGSLRYATLRVALRSVTKTLSAKTQILKVIRYRGHLDIAYCYWNAEQAYAACLLKRAGKISIVVSRAHGYDLYEERWPSRYMPLKRQFVDDFEVVYSIAEQGRRYLAKKYGFQPHKLRVSRLGVAIPEHITVPSVDDVIRVVSVSLCVAIKRIDKIIDAIRLACESEPSKRFDWIHVGDGSLREQIESRARELLGPLRNVSYQFIGDMPNEAVLSFYATNAVDVFINCSESEGIPVSIMEAMACGIPAIAPDVGGISELVDTECGVLLPACFTSADVVSGFARLTGADKQRFRSAARLRVVEHYSADTNFDAFIDNIRRLRQGAARSDDLPPLPHSATCPVQCD